MRLALGLLSCALLFCSCAKEHAESYILQLSDGDRMVRLSASMSLIKLGSAAVESLIEHGNSSDSLRYISAQILGKIGDRRASEFLQQLLQSPNQYVRERAVRALGQLGDVSHLPTIEKVLTQDSVIAVREGAAWGLGTLRDTAAVAALVAAQKDTSPIVRQTALSALQFLWTADAESAVRGALQDPDGRVRYVAVQMLGYHKSADALDELCLALADSSLGVRIESARALGLIGDLAAVGPLERLFGEREGPDHLAARDALGVLTGLEYAIAP